MFDEECVGVGSTHWKKLQPGDSEHVQKSLPFVADSFVTVFWVAGIPQLQGGSPPVTAAVEDGGGLLEDGVGLLDAGLGLGGRVDVGLGAAGRVDAGLGAAARADGGLGGGGSRSKPTTS